MSRFLSREERMERVGDQLIRLAGSERCDVIEVFDASFLRKREETCALANFETQRLFEDGVVFNDMEQEDFTEWYARYKKSTEVSSSVVEPRMVSESSDVNHPEVRDQLLKSLSRETSRPLRSLHATREELANGYMVMFICDGFKKSDLDVTCRDGLLRVYGKRETAQGFDEVSRMVPVKGADEGTLVIQMICNILVVTVNKRYNQE